MRRRRAAARERGLDILDRLGRIDVPTLGCAGELDPVTPVEAAAEIVALPEGIGRLEIVPGAGHFTWLDAPDRYRPVMIRLVESVAAVPS